MTTPVRVKELLVLALLACSALVGAQPAQPAPYTAIEAVKVQSLQRLAVIVQRSIEDYKAEAARLKAELEAARPGWTFNPETGQWSETPKATK